MAFDISPRPVPKAADNRSPVAASLVDALTVYVESLAGDARVAVLGDAELGLDETLLELGARTVHLYDPDPERVARVVDEVPRGVSVRVLRDEFEVRDGAFDLVVVPDLGVLPEPTAAIARLRRIVDPRGAVVAMGRARTSAPSQASFTELAPAAIDYAQLYDLFALEFESVTMTGVLPFTGVVFAELGAGDDMPVSVDTRLAAPTPPGVFVVVASRAGTKLDPYAIVQVGPDEEESNDDDDRADERDLSRTSEAAATFAAMQLKAELLAAQLDDHRSRLTFADHRGAEHVSRIEQLGFERDVALTRASELEAILGAAQQALEVIERRLLAAEQGMLERDDEIAALNAELDTRTSSANDAAVDGDRRDVASMGQLSEITARAERAEASLALHVADLAQLAEAHAAETAALEAQLVDRARIISTMERELGRREQLVRELVASLEEARDGTPGAIAFEAAPSVPGVAPEEVVRLRRKLDELATEVARRDGELVARGWRITELEGEKERASASRRDSQAATRDPSSLARDAARVADLERDLDTARAELDALRQALTQEHQARVAAESGDALLQARAELARQSDLLEQLKSVPPTPNGEN